MDAASEVTTRDKLDRGAQRDYVIEFTIEIYNVKRARCMIEVYSHEGQREVSMKAIETRAQKSANIGHLREKKSSIILHERTKYHYSYMGTMNEKKMCPLRMWGVLQDAASGLWKALNDNASVRIFFEGALESRVAAGCGLNAPHSTSRHIGAAGLTSRTKTV